MGTILAHVKAWHSVLCSASCQSDNGKAGTKPGFFIGGGGGGGSQCVSEGTHQIIMSFPSPAVGFLL